MIIKTLLTLLILLPVMRMGQDTKIGLSQDNKITRGSIVLPLLTNLFQEYKKECYNDSTLVRKISRPQYKFSEEGKLKVIPAYEYVIYSHKEPDFNDFIEWYLKKYK